MAGSLTAEAPNPEQCIHGGQDCAHSTRRASQRMLLTAQVHLDLGLTKLNDELDKNRIDNYLLQDYSELDYITKR